MDSFAVGIVIAISWLASSFLIRRALSRSMSNTEKALVVLMLLIPVLGPLAYFWISNIPDSHDDSMKNDLSHGGYLHREISREHGGSIWDSRSRKPPERPD